MTLNEQILELVINLEGVRSAYIFGSNADYICVEFLGDNGYWDYKITSPDFIQRIKRDMELISSRTQGD